jgi:hypothetical protein
MVATVLTLLRWACLLGTLFLPGFYVAMVNFHPEMIPLRLALSIMAARRSSAVMGVAPFYGRLSRTAGPP